MLNYKFLFFLLLPFALNAEVMKSLHVTGNINVESSLIKSQVSCVIDQECREEQLSESIKRLHATGLFQDISLKVDQGDLKVIVKENPIVNSIFIEGNKSVKTDEINDVMQLKVKSLFTDNKLQQDILKIITLYKNQGILDISVKPYQVALDHNKVDILYKIAEGSKAKIRSINFINNESFSDYILKNILFSKEYRFYNFFTNNHYYVYDRLALDDSLLKNFYFSKGFLNFKIISIVPEFDKYGVYLTITVDEDEKYHVNKVDVVSSIKNIDVTSIKKMTEDITEKSFNINKVNKNILDIISFLNDKGYYFIDVEPQYATEGNTVNITYNIKESRKVYIDKINIKGNDHTIENVIRREIKISEGDPYNLTLLNRSKQRINKLGFFNMVDFVTSSSTEKDMVNVDFSVKERNTGFMNIGGAFSSNVGLVGNFSVSESNLLGTGNKMSFSIEKSAPTFNLSLAFTKPYMFNSPISSGFNLFKNYSEYKQGAAYKMNTYGATLHSSYKISDNLTNTFKYSYKVDNIYDVNDKASKLIKEQAGITHTSLVGYNLSYDVLSNPINPKSGYLLKLKQELAGLGGDLCYLRSTFSAVNFITLLEDSDIIIKASLKGGYISGYNDQIVKIGQRFFAGSNEIRGFKGSGIGPRDKVTKDALGGKTRLMASLQTDFPIGFPEDLNIKGSLFLDAATLTSLDTMSDNIVDSGSIRVSTGFGFSWFSPLGLLRVDFGFPIVKEEHDQPEVLRFNMGTTF